MVHTITFARFETALAWDASVDVIAAAPKMSFAEIPFAELEHGKLMFFAKVDWSDGPLPAPVNCTISWIDEDEGKVMAHDTFQFQSGWEWGFMWSALGKWDGHYFTHPGKYSVLIQASGLFSESFPFTITGVPDVDNGAAEEEPAGYFAGRVYEKGTSDIIPGVSVVFNGYSSVTDYEGKYKIVVEGTVSGTATWSREGYKSYSGVATISPGDARTWNVWLAVAEAPVTSTLICTTSPSGAMIIIDREWIGLNTPAHVVLPVGDVTVVYKLEGYKTASVTTKVIAPYDVTAHAVLEPVDEVEPEMVLSDRQLELFREAYYAQGNLDAPERYFEDYPPEERGPLVKIFDLFKEAHESQGNLDTPNKYFEDYSEAQRTIIKGYFNKVFIPPVEEYQKLPVPPDTFPAAFLPLYKQLDDLLVAGDIPAILAFLKEHQLDEASPITFLAALGLAVGMLTSVIGIVGTYAFARFLFEETLQTLDMTFYEANSAKQYDLAAEVLVKKEEVLASGIYNNPAAYVPIGNIMNAVKIYTDAAAFKLAIDKKIIERRIALVSTPKPGDIGGWIDAADAGNPTGPFEPEARGLLRINVNAESGTVVIDGLGYSTLFPFQIELPPGTYTIEVGADGKVGQSKGVTLNPYEDKIVDFYLSAAADPEPEETMGKLILNSTPSGAKIYIDDVYLFEITNTTILVEPGHHKLTLKRKGYVDKSSSFDIAADETKSISLTLTPTEDEEVVLPEPEPGEPAEEVVVELVPAGVEYNAWRVTIRAVDSETKAELHAWILIDDVFMQKTTPFYFYLAPESTFNIKLKLTGYRMGEVTFTTKPLPTA